MAEPELPAGSSMDRNSMLQLAHRLFCRERTVIMSAVELRNRNRVASGPWPWIWHSAGSSMGVMTEKVPDPTEMVPPPSIRQRRSTEAREPGMSASPWSLIPVSVTT